MLTKQDIQAIRTADDICVHLNPRHPNGLVRLIKRRDYNKPFSEDQEHVLPATASVVHCPDRDTANAECFAMASFYYNQHTQTGLAFRSLRAGDEVVFAFYPDGYSNGYIAKAGLHGDLLQMYVRRNGKTIARWEIAHSVCADNSARMVRGIPNSKSYETMAADCRANAA